MLSFLWAQMVLADAGRLIRLCPIFSRPMRPGGCRGSRNGERASGLRSAPRLRALSSRCDLWPRGSVVWGVISNARSAVPLRQCDVL